MKILTASNFLKILAILLIISFASYFRFYHIEFGLPHSFHADEPEFTESAIKYTYELRDIIKNNNWYKMVPVSYVYGTLPTYLLTLALMLFSKINNLLNIPFDKTTLFLFMRQVTATIAMLALVATALLYFKTFIHSQHRWFGTILTLLLVALNWKLIVHAHYVNADMFLTVLLGFTLLFSVLYFQYSRNKYVVLMGIFFGLCVGTKITALISLPLFVYLFVYKKDIYGLAAFLLIIFGTFMLTNPFSLIFIRDFVFRIVSFSTKEAGLVFDSVNYNPFKYLGALAYMCTPFVVIFSMLGVFLAAKHKETKPLHILLSGHIIVYFVFYSLQSRLVDRWLLPVVPIILLYAAYGFLHFWELTCKNNDRGRPIVIGLFSLVFYLYFPLLLLFEYQKNTPKSAVYLWMRDNTPPLATKLAITEEGLDPLNKLPTSQVMQFLVYESEGAALTFPPDPLLYDYVVLASKPMEYYKNVYVQKKFPYYMSRWSQFENTVLDESKFVMIKDFVLPKPNLVNLSDVFVFKKVSAKYE